MLPYKLLAYLMYGPHQSQKFLFTLPDGKMRVRVGDMSTFLNTTRTKAYDTVEWLYTSKLIKSYDKKFVGKMKVAVLDIELMEPLDRHEEYRKLEEEAEKTKNAPETF